ncbi:MAG: hypothetical protein Aurels2KO_20040 [Aureliella sp.]
MCASDMDSDITPEPSSLNAASSQARRSGPSAKWVGYELHDGLLQWLVGARMMLEAKLDRPESDDSKLASIDDDAWTSVEVRKLFQSTFQSLEAAIDEGRALITFLEQHTEHPEFDIQQATEDFLDFLPRRTPKGEIDIQFKGLSGAVSLPPQVGWNVLRIIQQAVRNALFHSGASVVKVGLTLGSSGSSGCCVTIEDDGCGFDVASAVAKSARSNHFGLASMQHRAQQLGGDLVIQSEPGSGSRVEFSFPTVGQ